MTEINQAELLRSSQDATRDVLRTFAGCIPGSGDGVRGLLALAIAYETALSSEALAGDDMKARAALIRELAAAVLGTGPDLGLLARRASYLVTLDANRGAEVHPEEVVVRSGELLVEIAKKSDDTQAAAAIVALGAGSELVLRRLQVGTGTRFRQIVRMIVDGTEGEG